MTECKKTKATFHWNSFFFHLNLTVLLIKALDAKRLNMRISSRVLIWAHIYPCREHVMNSSVKSDFFFFWNTNRGKIIFSLSYSEVAQKISKMLFKDCCFVKDGNVISIHFICLRSKWKKDWRIHCDIVRRCKKTIIIETATPFTCRIFTVCTTENYHFSLARWGFFFVHRDDLWFSVANMIYIKWKTIYEDSKRMNRKRKFRIFSIAMRKCHKTKVNQTNNE